ncbi:SDR family NAD(P)-dependent oxidoreductase [Nioella sediminis]|jgi:NAD(P)-dependent dehydrogenase (short-subunit alcohol dehydrogenase family)|uniref:SDR family NAD(P)-dependent oxidoreductase n=1 Tax=Nioella sediminis TaxID=1912092 RepID=UPI0008FD60F4|nr:SDR family oxidoreductase [Nioella sediminis]TBX16346.1 oxidoreductase [Roseovarius sp. JS7-11]
MEHKSLDGRIALVTGASRGLGAACAEWLAARGAHVVAVARTTGGLEELDDRIQAKGGSTTLAPMDITTEAAMAHLCRSIHDRWGKADIWVHAAIHATALTPAAQIREKDLDANIATNIRATARLIAMVEPLIEPSDIATAVFFDDDGEAMYGGAYAMSKAAQRALVSRWQAESAKHGPRVALLKPNPMPTAVRARFHPGEDRDALASPRDEAARLLAPLFPA